MQRVTSNILFFATFASMAVGLACGSSGGSGGSGASSGTGGTGATSGTGGTGATSGTSPSTGASSGGGASACKNPSTKTVSLQNDLMPIIQSNCSIGGTSAGGGSCHGDPDATNSAEPGGSRQYFGPPTPALSATTTPSLTTIYQGFVTDKNGKAVPSLEDPNMDIVHPNDPSMSFLWLKLTTDSNTLIASPLCNRGDLGTCGSQMPLPFSPDGGATGAVVPLVQADLDVFCNWITQGAKNN
jgi:hypothetical protein